eukprot:24871_5
MSAGALQTLGWGCADWQLAAAVAPPERDPLPPLQMHNSMSEPWLNLNRFLTFFGPTHYVAIVHVDNVPIGPNPRFIGPGGAGLV